MKVFGVARILSICDDEHLAASRELVLRAAKYEVESIPSYTNLSERSAKPFQAAILCHSISEAQTHALIKGLRRLFTGIRILGISRFAAKPDPELDGGCCLDDGPPGLLRAVDALLHKETIAPPPPSVAKETMTPPFVSRTARK